MWRHFQWNEPHITEDVRKFLKQGDSPRWFPDSTLKLNNSRTTWPIPAIYISFSSILNALSYKINLFSRCSSPLNDSRYCTFFTPFKIILHVLKFSFVLRCCHGNQLFSTCRRIENWGNSFKLQDISWTVLKLCRQRGAMITNPDMAKNYYDVIMTSLWRKFGFFVSDK